MESMDRTKSLLARSRPVPFLYDRAKKEFVVDGNMLPLDAVSDRGLRHRYGGEKLSSDEVESLIEDTPLVHTYSRPVTLPKFSRFIVESWDADLEEEVISVMSEVMPALPDLLDHSFDRLGFGAARGSSKIGQVVLKVPGICACIGPDATVMRFGEDSWRDQIMAYTTHNTDRSIQHAALLAGLGHIATLAR